jgi:uncharacterized protein YkwD
MRLPATIFFISILQFALATNRETPNNLHTAANANYLSPIEKEIVHEINLFRSDPAKYAETYIAPLAKLYKGNLLYYPNDKPLRTKEGAKAVHECVRELKKAKPLPIIYPNQLLTKAAADHAKDQSRTGKTGHYGSDGSNLRKRIERYGSWKVRIAENIAYGGMSARQVIIYLLVDDGQYDRGHRKNFLLPDLNLVGVAVNSHPAYGKIAVMDFAGGMDGK